MQGSLLGHMHADLLLLCSDRDSCEAAHSSSNPPHPTPSPKCLPTHTPEYEDTRICNRKDNPPLWSARSGFFIMFISNDKLFSYMTFSFSASAGQIYFFRQHSLRCRCCAQ